MKFDWAKIINIKRKKTFFLIFIILNLIFFSILILNSYYFKNQSIDFQNLPLLRKNYTNYKAKFAENDGLIFENQEKIIYNNLMQKNSHKNNSSTEKVRKQISHQDIMDKLTKVQNNQEEPKASKKVTSNTKKNNDVFSLLKD